MDIVNVILQPVVESLLVPVKKHVDFMTSCKKYVKDMETGMGELNDTRCDVEKHMKENKGSNLVIPTHVPVWLKEVEKVDAEVNIIISSNVGSCFSFTTRHDVGKKAFNMIQDIKRLTEEHSRIEWTNHPIPLGKVDSMTVSTSSPLADYHSDFESREQTFMEALKALEPDHKSHMIALCGMGGVGKTTMMERLKTVVKEKRMFSLIVEAVIGEKTDPFAIQDAIADYLAIKDFKDISSTPARAVKLREWFKNYSEGGKKKILVIFDDIWQPVDLKDIGLSPFPDQGVDFKVLLTSRSRDVCTTMGVKANSVFNVKILAEAEARRFFWQFINDSDEADLDPDLRKVGDEIVSRCQGLPIAIKTIANTLKGKSKSVWDDTRTCLQHHDIHVNEVFELSYKNLEDEQTKSVFLLCGLYPEDFDIPTEELVRYGWGLKLFNNVYSLRQARDRLNRCIVGLLNTNLLIESNRAGCIKMHDLVRAFVLKMYSKVEHASIVNHGNMSEWPANDKPDFFKRISLACKGMEEFPRDFKYPNLSFLKLTQRDKSLRFPENFYGLMEKLQVIVYEKIQYPLLPSSLENLRTLCLHECSLMFNCDSIGSLLNLEVLSFANCHIEKLPSTIRNLKKLKLLDLTGYVNLHIDDGILKNLVKLEELYMKVAYGKAISFTDGNFNELAERSKKLSALEIELFGNNAHLKSMSFDNLERFKISIGRFLEMEYGKTTSFENTLMLVSNKGALLESRINVLFEKTVVLHLEVDGMNDLEDFKVKSLHSIEYSSFYRLRVLNVSKCAQLRYLFTRHVASTLFKLEHLKVLSCGIMQTLIHDEDSGSEPIKFPSLKFLSFSGLPKLAGLCNTGSVIELPQLTELQLDDLPNFTSIFPDDNLASYSMSNDNFTMQPFFNEGVVIPKLETLQIREMNKLDKIWSSKVTRSESVHFSMLKMIKVEECDRLVNLFPRNPMPLLHHLKEISVVSCRSIETIFKVDMECVPETGEGSNSLVNIFVRNSENLRQVWSLKNADSSNNQFQPEEVAVALRSLCQYSRVIRIENCDALSSAIPSYALTHMQNLEELRIEYCWSMKDVFEIKRVNDVGSCSGGEGSVVSFTTPPPQKLPNMILPPDYLRNLRNLVIYDCPHLRDVFPFSTLKSLTKLEHLTIQYCDDIRVIVKKEEDGNHTTTTSSDDDDEVVVFPRLKSMKLESLRNLESFFLGTNDFRWPVLDTVRIVGCPNMTTFTQGHSDSPMLNYLSSDMGENSVECGLNNLFHPTTTAALQQQQVPYPSLDASTSLPVSERMPWFYNNLIEVDVRKRWDQKRYIIGHNELQHMLKIEKLQILYCSAEREVFETFEMNNGWNQTHSVVEVREMDFSHLFDIKCLWRSKQWAVLKFPNLTRLSIYNCHSLKHVFTISMVGSLLQLQELHISNCPKMEMILADVEKEEDEEEEYSEEDEEEEDEEEDEEDKEMEIVLEDVEKEQDDEKQQDGDDGKEEGDDGVNEDGEKEEQDDDDRRVDEVEFPCLRSLSLRNLWSLKGFCLGMETIHWPSLDTLKIKRCPEITTFTNGESTTPKLKFIKTSFGLCDATEGVNSFIQTKVKEGYKFA